MVKKVHFTKYCAELTRSAAQYLALQLRGQGYKSSLTRDKDKYSVFRSSEKESRGDKWQG